MAPVSIGFREIKKGVPIGTPPHMLFGRGLALARSEPAGATPRSFRNRRYSDREPHPHDRTQSTTGASSLPTPPVRGSSRIEIFYHIRSERGTDPCAFVVQSGSRNTVGGSVSRHVRMATDMNAKNAPRRCRAVASQAWSRSAWSFAFSPLIAFTRSRGSGRKANGVCVLIL